jgi:hypothetical protein
LIFAIDHIGLAINGTGFDDGKNQKILGKIKKFFVIVPQEVQKKTNSICLPRTGYIFHDSRKFVDGGVV